MADSPFPPNWTMVEQTRRKANPVFYILRVCKQGVAGRITVKKYVPAKTKSGKIVWRFSHIHQEGIRIGAFRGKHYYRTAEAWRKAHNVPLDDIELAAYAAWKLDPNRETTQFVRASNERITP